MSIESYLNNLDYEQLRNARKIAGSLINKKDNENKVTLWMISDDYVNYAAFVTDDYEKAVLRLCDEIKNAAKEAPNDPIELTLRTILVRESEVAVYLKL